MAQTIQFIPCTDGGAGTSKQSYLFASTNDLKTMFGDPWFEGIGDDISGKGGWSARSLRK